jgi:hypothetical protein
VSHLGWYAAAVLLALYAVIPALADAPAGENLLRNPGFEDGFVQYGPFQTAVVAEGWQPWWKPQSAADPPWRNRMPEYKAAAPYRDRVGSGRNAQQLFTAYGTHAGGIYQTVTGLQPGSTVRFTIWGHAWAGQDDDPHRSVSGGPMHASIGLDPTGGTNPFSPRVVWSEERNPLDEWTQFGLEAEAAGSAVTAFTRSAPNFPTRHNDVYWDDAELATVRLAPAPTTTPNAFFEPAGVTPATPPATYGSLTWDHAEPAPTATVKPLPGPLQTPGSASGHPDRRAVPTPMPALTLPVTAAICVTAYEDRNANRSRDGNEPDVAGARVMLERESRSAREFLTTGADEPVCFVDLEAGVYYLVVIAPPGYRSLASSTWQIGLGRKEAHILVGLRKIYRPDGFLAQAQGASPAVDRDNGVLAPWMLFLVAGGTLSVTGFVAWSKVT